MIWHKDTAKITAVKLLETGAVQLRPERPFTWASGMRSPVYCDNRVALSFPGVREFIAGRMADIVRSEFPGTEVVAGVATGAIAWGVLVAGILDLPFVYVRPSPKKHGRQNRVEGYLPPHSKTLVIEDLISTGMSSMSAVLALREAKTEILGMTAVFSYGFESAIRLFDDKGIRVYTLSDFETLVRVGQEKGKFSEAERQTLLEWRRNPGGWEY